MVVLDIAASEYQTKTLADSSLVVVFETVDERVEGRCVGKKTKTVGENRRIDHAIDAAIAVYLHRQSTLPTWVTKAR